MDAQRIEIRKGTHMKINRNMAAVTANTRLLRTENKLQASIGRLSSGYKINSAGDNPAGMAISNKMKAQIDGLDQANSNANDGVSVLQIADGALNEVASMLQRMRELSVQAANDTYTADDKQSIQNEIDELRKEVDRISSDTEYNTKTLLDGSSDVRVYSKESTRLNVSEHVATGTYSVNVTDVAKQAEKTYTMPQNLVEGTVTVNSREITVTNNMSVDDFYDQLGAAIESAGGSLEIDRNTNEFTVKTDLYGSKAVLNVSFSKDLYKEFGGTVKDDVETYTESTYGADAQVSLGDGFGDNATCRTDGNRVYVRDNNGFSMDFLVNSDLLDGVDENGNPYTDRDVDIEVTDIGAMKIQIGSNQYQEMSVRIPEISSKSMYLDTIDVVSYGGADRAMSTLDDAIAKLSSVRSTIGAFQNRLDYANNSLSETVEDMTSAYSGILDTDMAEEMTEYAQQNILNQATISVLSQANDLPQQVLSLLSR